jgi:hypothetical protein
MKHKLIRVVIGVPEAFIALSAIGGGIIMLAGSEPYADSVEELTPFRLDWISIVPLLMLVIALLVSPARALTLARGGWGAHLLDVGSIRTIEGEDFGERRPL